MLSKDVCRRCIDSHPDDWWDDSGADDDNHNWKKGIIHCVITDQKHLIKELPPKECVYLFEQTVAAGVKNAE